MSKATYIACVCVVGILIIAVFSFASNQDGNEAQRPVVDYPAFLKAVSAARSAYSHADNDLKRSEIRKARDEAVSAAVPDGVFVNWRGTLMSMSTNAQGNASIKVGLKDCYCGVLTAPDAEIPIGSDLFNRIKEMKEGDHVIINGVMGKESSFTESGSVDDPEWYAQFSDVSVDPVPY